MWSNDRAHALHVAMQLEVGAVMINDTIVHFTLPRVPIGGVKQSEMGVCMARLTCCNLRKRGLMLSVIHRIHWSLWYWVAKRRIMILWTAVSVVFRCNTKAKKLEAFRLTKELPETFRSTGRVLPIRRGLP